MFLLLLWDKVSPKMALNSSSSVLHLPTPGFTQSLCTTTLHLVAWWRALRCHWRWISTDWLGSGFTGRKTDSRRLLLSQKEVGRIFFFWHQGSEYCPVLWQEKRQGQILRRRRWRVEPFLKFLSSPSVSYTRTRVVPPNCIHSLMHLLIHSFLKIFFNDLFISVSLVCMSLWGYQIPWSWRYGQLWAAMRVLEIEPRSFGKSS